MSRLHERLLEEMMLTEGLNAVGEGAPSLEEKCRIVASIRGGSPEAGQRLDRMLLADREGLIAGLNEAQANLGKLKAILDKLANPPWHVGVFICALDPAHVRVDRRVLVYLAGKPAIISLADDVDVNKLALGDEVFLTHELTAVMGTCPQTMPRVGETAVFDRYTEDGRLVLKWRDDELIADAAAALQQVTLQSGDRVRVDRSVWIAYEKLEQAAERRYFLGEIPKARLNQVGGQRRSLEALLAALQTTLAQPETAALYGLTGRHSVLLVGPPGCGKTLMARVVCAEISRTTGKPCRFAVVKPAEWWDPYVGVTEQNIRACFQALVEAAQESGLAVLFMDEIESVGRVRGSAVGHHSDRFLDALLAELDGFSERSGVAVMAATNRKDLCDPSLLDRFDQEVPVLRPDLRGAREIFAIHLSESMPFSPNGKAAPETRLDMIERAVSRLYSPNGENEVCVVKFRDGKSRTVAARELASGRMIEQVCRAARQTAFQRHVRSGERGLRVEDIEDAVSEAIERLSTALTPRNAHAYLSDLPQDIDVVAVEPIVRRITRSHRYLTG